jgi:hypothetical protein
MSGPAEPRKFTRSGLVKTGAVAALAVGAGGTANALGGVQDLAASGIGKPLGGPAFLRHATYEPLVGTDFGVLRSDGSTMKMRLIRVQHLPSRGESFSLLFRARRQHTDVDGRLYRIDHPALGSFELFVNPVGRGVKGLDLEAVVNRIAT